MNCLSLYVSEVLVILSSCIFVVMAILTGVISVTSMTTIRNNSDQNEYNLITYPLSKFIVNENFDTLFMSCENKKQEVLYPIYSLIYSSFRNEMITQNHIKSTDFTLLLDPSEKLEKYFNQIEYDNITSFSNVYYDFFSSIKGKDEIFSCDENKFIFKDINFLNDIDRIKRYISKYQSPILLTIPKYLKSVENNGIIQTMDFNYNESQGFLIYGWNDDFITKANHLLGYEDTYVGGFIIRQHQSLQTGHSISYLNGDIDMFQEKSICSNPKNPYSFPLIRNESKIDIEAKLTCINSTFCNKKASYYLLSSETDEEKPFIRANEENNTITVKVLVMQNNNISVEEIELDSFGSLGNYFEVYFKNYDHCQFWFLPYAIFKELATCYQCFTQSLLAVGTDLTWEIKNTLYVFATISHRPKPIFDQT